MLSIFVKNEKQDTTFEHPSGPIEFGRSPTQSAVRRFVLEDGFASRDHLRVEELPSGRARVQNLSAKYTVQLGAGQELGAGETREFALPFTARLGESDLEFRAGRTPPPPPAPGIADEGFQALRPVLAADGLKSMPPLIAAGESPSAATLAQWMETVLALQRSNAGPSEFYPQTARALVRMVGLDVGLVLMLGERGWKVVARAAREGDDDRRPGVGGREFSQTVLRQVQLEKQTFFQDLAQMKSQESLRSVDAVVASPVFGLGDEVVGALYGLRRPAASGTDCKIRPLEAQLVQLLAAAVGTNMARTAATRTRTQFEQFFSAELVRELERDPGLLEGRSHEVTILMSDLRGFSALSEKLGPEQTCRLVRDVMERLSEWIVTHGGVIVSYLGDGILAMWNAPAQQDDHAVRACRAALDMLRELPALNERWQGVVGKPLGLGIGVNTGPAQVGNTGSSRKFMYGPLGNTVNLASRVEGATKHFKVPILVTGSTRERLGGAFATRRLCQVRVVGIHGAVDLHELQGETATPEWLAARDTYEAALTMFQSRQWLKACQILLPLLDSGPNGHYDQATLNLMRRSWSCLEAPPDSFDPVMEMSSK